MKTEHSYNKDAEYGDLGEQKYVDFLNYYNNINNKEKYILRLGYTTTIREVVTKIMNDTKIDNVEKIINDKLNLNYFKLLNFYKRNPKIIERFKVMDEVDLIQSLKTKLKIDVNNRINQETRIQTLGIDIIEIDLDTLKINFIEVKSFTVVNKMYDKLGIEYWSNFGQKTLGFTFTMLCDTVVYSQDVNTEIEYDYKSKQEEIKKVLNGRINKDYDVDTYYNMFYYLEYLKKSVQEINKYENKSIYFIKTTTNKTHSNFMLLNYDLFEKLHKTIIFKTIGDKQEFSTI